MDFFTSAIDVLQTLVVALGAGLGIWGVINLLEGYGQDNPASKSPGMKPVSYTHLDVYKRQVLPISRESIRYLWLECSLWRAD